MAISNAPQSGDQPAVGKTPTDDVRARKLLAETRIPVGKIAEQLGFNSPQNSIASGVRR